MCKSHANNVVAKLDQCQMESSVNAESVNDAVNVLLVHFKLIMIY